jgi:hypothetical protein
MIIATEMTKLVELSDGTITINFWLIFFLALGVFVWLVHNA